MKIYSGKSIDPTKLQTWALEDLRSYHKIVAQRAKKYLKRATISVSTCCICGSKHSVSLHNAYSFHYVRCVKCSHVYSTRRLSQDDLASFYRDSAEYAQTYTDKKQLMYRYEQVAKPKVDFIMRHIGKRKRISSWLDVGCGVGDIPHAVEQYKGWKVTGIDISTSSIKAGKKVFGANLQQAQFLAFADENKTQQYDVVSFFGYLGLISNPLEELRRAAKMVKKGGYLVVGEENAASLSTCIQQTYPEFISRHLIPPNVVHQFSNTSLEKAMKLVGYQPIALWNFGLDFYELMKTMCLLDKRFQTSPLYGFLLQNVNDFQLTIDKQKMGDYMIMVAKQK